MAGWFGVHAQRFLRLMTAVVQQPPPWGHVEVQLLWPRNIVRPGRFRQFTDLLQGQLRNTLRASHTNQSPPRSSTSPASVARHPAGRPTPEGVGRTPPKIWRRHSPAPPAAAWARSPDQPRRSPPAATLHPVIFFYARQHHRPAIGMTARRAVGVCGGRTTARCGVDSRQRW
jgi:hypothetical protein